MAIVSGPKKVSKYLTAQGKLLCKHRPKDQTVFSLPYQMTTLLKLNTPGSRNATAAGFENANELKSFERKIFLHSYPQRITITYAGNEKK